MLSSQHQLGKDFPWFSLPGAVTVAQTYQDTTPGWQCQLLVKGEAMSALPSKGVRPPSTWQENPSSQIRRCERGTEAGDLVPPQHQSQETLTFLRDTLEAGGRHRFWVIYTR